jgi:hypothetical protein
MGTGFDSIVEDRFGSVGIGESEIDRIHLYANQWVLVNKIRIFASRDTLR